MRELNEIANRDEKEYDQFGRPSWDAYFMTLSFLIAQKSIDPNTKHGAILVAKDNRILSTGYNGPIKGVNDTKVPLTRPEKYWTMQHSELNCILAYNGPFAELEGARMYVTGEPCHRCLGMMVQKGIKHIICGYVESKCMGEEDSNAKKLILELVKNVRIERYIEPVKMKNILNKTITYINDKAL